MRGSLPVVALILLVAKTQVIFSTNCNHGDVQLVGGTSQYEGRVEVCINNAWGTVCDDSWNSADATVVCRQLGYATTGSGEALINAHFGQGTGQIVLGDVQCSGSESQLVDCTRAENQAVSSNCGHSDDAGVRCSAPCKTDQLRLMGGNIPNEGRVEICKNNDWGTICDDFWSSTDATVVCRQLGYSTQDAVAFGDAHFGAGTGTIYLDNVGCTGSETRLIDCSRSTTVSCLGGHSQDAGVRCQVSVRGSCAYGGVRLVGGSNQYEGRVEVCINDQWGTVCDDIWDTTDATVVCKQLGYATTGSGVAYSKARFGAGTGPIFLDNVQCTSSSSQLLECSSSPILSHNCQHSDDASVGCEVPCTNNELRLVGGNVPNEGRVEICEDNVWGTVCDDSWDTTDASVVCRQLGYLRKGAVAFSRAHFAAGTGTIHMDNVDCTGSETNLIKCSHSAKISCTHLEDAGVRCRVPCANGQLRLVGTNILNEGRVEICMNNVWGTVCDDSWSSIDAIVVCRQLGFSTTGAMAFGSAYFGTGTGTILMDDVGCTGSEANLADCSYSSTINCAGGHLEDAGVRCQVAAPTCLPIGSQSAVANTLVAILHDYTNSQFTSAAEANFTAATEQIINTYCSTYRQACVHATSSMVSACVTVVRTEDNRNGQLAVTFFVSFNGSVLDSSTAMIALQAGITNSDYEAAGFSGQLDVVSLDTYNESQTGVNITAVVVPIVIIAILVVVIIVAVVLLLIIKAKKAKKCNIMSVCRERTESVERSQESGRDSYYEPIFLDLNPKHGPPTMQHPANTHIHQTQLRSH